MRSKKKGSGSFFIPRKAVDALLQTGDQARWLIPSYLKLAAHTDAEGLYTTAGRTSIRKTLKRNKDDSIKFTKKLVKMKLIHTTDQWQKKTGEVFPDDVPEKQRVRFVLNDFNEDKSDMVWFNRTLIDGIGEFENPLRRLADCGGVGARMFLYFYSEYDVQLFHAFNPNRTIFKMYSPDGDAWSTNYRIKEWQPRPEALTGCVRRRVFPGINDWDEIDNSELWQDENSHWEAINNLEAAGFIYEMASIVSAPIKKKTGGDGWSDAGYVDMENMSVVYELANRDRFAVDTGELHELIKETVSMMDVEINHQNVYSILPTGSTHSVIGLYKPRFAPDNTRNAFVLESMDNRREDKAQALRWVKHFRTTKRLEFDKQQTSIPEVEQPTEPVSSPKANPIDQPTGGEVVIQLPLHGNAEQQYYNVTVNEVAEWQSLYPTVNIKQQLHEMKEALDSNRVRCRTEKGIINFIKHYLDKLTIGS